MNPAHFPDRSVVSEYLEPMVLGTILAPDSYTGKIMSLCLVSVKVENAFRLNEKLLSVLFNLNVLCLHHKGLNIVFEVRER